MVHIAERFHSGLADIVSSSGFIGGDSVDSFESDWARYCGVDHVIGVGNGTDALELILQAANIGPGDEVILPAATFVATAEAVMRVGAVPVFADSGPTSVLIDFAHAESLISDRTRAIIIVHLYGLVVDPRRFVEVARKRGLMLIEDAAQAHGATWADARVGSLGDAASFSFYPTKNLGAIGDAGAVTTSDAHLAERVRSISRHGRATLNHGDHELLGRNSRMDAIQALALNLKLEHLDAWNEARRARVDQYADGLADYVTEVPAAESEPVWHVLPVYSSGRERLRQHLAASGISTGVHYEQPCHRWPVMHSGESLPHAERWFREEVSLPIDPFIESSEIEIVCDALGTFKDR